MTPRAPREIRIDPDPEGERRRAARARLGLEVVDSRPGQRRGLLARVLAGLAWTGLGAALLSVLAVAVLRVIDPPLSALMLGEWLQAQRDGEAGRAHCSFFPMRWVRNWISTIAAKEKATSVAERMPAARSSKACTWS